MDPDDWDDDPRMRLPPDAQTGTGTGTGMSERTYDVLRKASWLVGMAGAVAMLVGIVWLHDMTLFATGLTALGVFQVGMGFAVMERPDLGNDEDVGGVYGSAKSDGEAAGVGVVYFFAGILFVGLGLYALFIRVPPV